MKKSILHKPLLLTMITAFIFMQWSATHIHLAGEHEHDGTQHQHSALAHQHQLAQHHTDNIDSASDYLSHYNSQNIVELELDCVQCKLSSAKQHISIQPGNWSIPEPVISGNSLILTYQSIPYQSYYQYSTIYLRAPPSFS